MKFENTAVAVKIKEYNDSLLYRDVEYIWESLQDLRKKHAKLQDEISEWIDSLKCLEVRNENCPKEL